MTTLERKKTLSEGSPHQYPAIFFDPRPTWDLFLLSATLITGFFQLPRVLCANLCFVFSCIEPGHAVGPNLPYEAFFIVFVFKRGTRRSPQYHSAYRR
jgi:hypothetical protein